MKKTGFYIIKDKFFEDMTDPYLKRNKAGNRPHYYCFEDSSIGIYWMIPLSSRIDKYRRIMEKKEKAGKPCDILHIAKLDDSRESAFLIQDMFPITEEYIEREYTIAAVNHDIEKIRYVSLFNRRYERIINMSRQIRTSAKAVIIQNGKLLAIKLNDGKEEWYILPGGGQDCEEMLPQTVEREVREEAGIEVKCKDLLFVIEGVHGESFHRMDLVFSCDYLGSAQNTTLQGDTNQVGFDWLDLSILNKLPLFPSKLRRPIMNFHEGKEYMKYLGNEEIGDPECLE